MSSEDTESVVEDAQNALNEARARLAEIPAETVVVNHVMGLYELAAIHLGASPPRLGEASLAIDAVACLVEGLGERLGPETSHADRGAVQHPPRIRPDQSRNPGRQLTDRQTSAMRDEPLHAAHFSSRWVRSLAR